MLNQMATTSGEPKMYSATYVENYLDSVENLPNDVTRYLTRIREIDLQYRVHLRDVDYYYDQWSNCSTNELESSNVTSKRTRAMARIQQNLIAAQELGDEKLQVVTQLQEMIDQKTRQLDADFKNLEYADKDDPALMDTSPKEMQPSSPSSYAPSSMSQKNDDGSIAGSSGVPSATNLDRNHSNATSNSTNHSQNSNWKRSRRARDAATRTNSNANHFSNMSKPSQIDMASDSNNSNSNHSHKNSHIIGQQAIIGTNSTRKQGANNNTNNSSSNNNNNNNNNNNKKRKRKSTRTQNNGNGGNNSNNLNNSQNSGRIHDETPPFEEAIDPDEPTYCLCDQISFGEMILCDNDLCPIEWFHFSCVSLTTKPKGKWFCPNCRGDRPSVMKPKQQFLKELERYNREKEEKT